MNHHFLDLRPPAQKLGLLIRAALVPDGRGGPWLWLGRSLDHLAATHHIATTPATTVDHTRLEMLSGAEALAFAVSHGWGSPEALTNPSVAQLRGLGVHAMQAHNVTLWATDYDAWVEWWTAEETVRAQDARRISAAEAATDLRRAVAEQWLRQ